MRKTATVTFVLCWLTAGLVFAQLPSNHLEGTWQLISQHEVYPDTVIVNPDPPKSMKILNSTHFAWGFQSEDGEEALAGGGRYVLEGSKYVEYIDYHISGPLVGLDIVFEARVVGDSLWYHTGSFPSGYRLEEVWRRVK